MKKQEKYAGSTMDALKGGPLLGSAMGESDLLKDLTTTILTN